MGRDLTTRSILGGSVWVLLIGLGACTWERQAPENVLTVYSSRADHLIKPIFDLYTEETGVEIRYLTDSEGPLIERLKAEGERSPADIFMTVDAGNLWRAASEGLLRSVDSEVLSRNIPAHLQDPEGQWFGFSVRARTIFYAPDRVDPNELSTYEALGDSKWEDRLCLRTSRKVYNQSLVAAMIAHYGEQKTEEMVKAWIDNLATDVFSSDTELLRAIAAGQCDVGIANSYYYGRLIRETPDFPVSLFWARLNEQGTHLNISGAGVTRHAPQAELAISFLEWLSAGEAQAAFAQLNLEYPANPEVAQDPIVRAWGEFQADQLNLRRVGELQSSSTRLMDRAQYR